MAKDSGLVVVDSSAAKASTSTTKAGPPHPPPSQSLPQTSSSSISSSANLPNLDDEDPGGPRDNWEVAYVYAFITKFTSLRSFTSASSLLPDVFALESALVESSPKDSDFLTSSKKKKKFGSTSSLSSLSDVEDGDDQVMKGTAKGSKARQTSPSSSLSSLSDTEKDPIGNVNVLKEEDEKENFEEDEESPQEEEQNSIPVPPTSPLLVKIIQTFQANLPEGDVDTSRAKKGWLPQLSRFVAAHTSSSTYNPSWNAKKVKGMDLRTGGEGRLRFRRNLLRRIGEKGGNEREEDWWRLRWEDKIHILRVLVDVQLDSSPIIREYIKETYNLHHQKNARREPENNHLVIKPMGKHGKRTIWSLDDTPRLYCSGNPYRVSSPFTVLSSTKEGYNTFLESLPRAPTPPPEPTPAPVTEETKKGDEVKLAGPFAKAKADADKLKKKKAEKAKEKEEKEKGKKKKVITEGMQELMNLRGKLEKHLGAIEAAEEALVESRLRREKAQERARERDARLAKQLSRMGASSINTRSSRLRTATKKVDYTYQSSDVEEDTTVAYASRKRKAVEPDEEEEDWSDGGDKEDEEDTNAARKLRRGSGSGENGRPEWRGERRSNRIQLQETEEEDEEMMDEEEGEEHDEPVSGPSGWKRPVVPSSPSSRDSPSQGDNDKSDRSASSSSPTEEFSEFEEKQPLKVNEAKEVEGGANGHSEVMDTKE